VEKPSVRNRVAAKDQTRKCRSDFAVDDIRFVPLIIGMTGKTAQSGEEVTPAFYSGETGRRLSTASIIT